MPDVVFPDRIAGHLYVALTDKQKKEQQEAAAKRPKSLRTGFKILQEFHRTLPKVQRALANVPTYMILDDHDVTDDYFLNPMWRDRVLTSAARTGDPAQRDDRLRALPGLGQRPAALPDRPPGGAADAGAAALSRGCHDRPRPARSREKLAQLFGHDLRNTPTADGQLRLGDAADPVALHRRRSEAPRHRLRQPHASQLRVAQRAAGQRVDRRPGRPDPAATVCRPAARCSSSSRRCR